MSNSALVFALSALKKANTANERIDALPLPMVFKGTLGTGGTISTLPTASSENEGFVYIVITDGTYAGQTAKAGDTFVSDGSSWVLVPSADEPSVIDDSVTSAALTWSSSKIANELGGLVKTFTYTGSGRIYNTINIPSDCHCILMVDGDVESPGTPAYDYSSSVGVIPIRSSGTIEASVGLFIKGSSNRSVVPWHITFNDGYIETNSSSNAVYNLNQTDKVYTVTYI